MHVVKSVEKNFLRSVEKKRVNLCIFNNKYNMTWDGPLQGRFDAGKKYLPYEKCAQNEVKILNKMGAFTLI